jgi:hypothetical protein
MAQPRVGLVLGDRQFASDSGVLGLLAAYESAVAARTFERQQAECYYAYSNNMAVRMSILKAAGGFQKLARGADTLLLRRVVDQYGSAALRYIPDMMVRHLEIAGIRDYLRKKMIYGRLRRLKVPGAPLSLPLAARWELALQARRESAGSLADTVAFFSTLAAGAIVFEWCAARGDTIR